MIKTKEQYQDISSQAREITKTLFFVLEGSPDEYEHLPLHNSERRISRLRLTNLWGLLGAYELKQEAKGG